MIAVVLPCCERDQHQAIWLLEWWAQLDFNPTELYIICSDRCKWSQMVELGKKSFSSVKWVQDNQDIDSNWHEIGNHTKSAAGPNSLFRAIAWDFYLTYKKAFLFNEPDAVATRKDWLRTVDSEWEVALAQGKKFLGFRVNRQTHPGDVGSHMSGVAVYHPDLPQLANKAVEVSDVAFDIIGAEQICPQMMDSQTIFHRYRPPGFTTQEDFDERVPSRLAIYHACKDGSLFPFLAQRLEVQWSTPIPTKKFFVSETPMTMTPVPKGMVLNGTTLSVSGPIVDIYIKTRAHDYPWLEWCIKSIQKFASGFRNTIVLDDTVQELRLWNGVENKTVFSKEPGYLWQQVCKLHADQYSDADFILFQDSDTIFTRPINPSDFIKNGKPIWQYTPLDQARSDQHIWVPVMEKFLGKKPEHEFMRRHPFCVPRWAFEEFRTFCKYRHGQSLEQYILGQADPSNGLALVFSEWNCLGFFLWEYHRDRVEWVLDADAGPACVHQGFTHGGESRKLEDIAKFKELLGSTTHDGTSAGDGVTRPPLTIEEALAFIATQAGGEKAVEKLRRSLAPKVSKHKGRKPGSKNKPKVVHPKKDRWLLAIHSYTGANEALERHWNNFLLAGADRIVGIGTTDGECKFPCESVNIGENAYMKLKGKDDHLCRRLADTVEWCLKQKEDRFVIAEYDVLFLKKFPKFHGVAAFLTGGKVNGSTTNQFFHGPWAFDRESGVRLLKALRDVLPDSQEYPNNSPDLFFGLACERAQIPVTCPWKMFTRNSLDEPGSLDLAVQAALDGAHCIHGVKQEFEFTTIMNALNNRHLELSHAQ